SSVITSPLASKVTVFSIAAVPTPPSTIPWPATARLQTGINNAGQVVGWYKDASLRYHGFLYRGGTYTTLDDPLAGANGTVLAGINNAGQMVGWYWDASVKIHGFLYSGGTYTTLDDPSATGDTLALGINAAGQHVG